MKIEITFSTDNAAFEDNLLGEVFDTTIKAAQILVDAIKDAQDEVTDFTQPLRDVNGNTIGHVKVTV